MLLVKSRGTNLITNWRTKVIINALKEWLEPNTKVLDIGCGDMLITKELRDCFNLDIIGTDVLSYKKVALPFILNMTDELPFGDKEFDFALIISTLHHCEEPKRVLDEALRVANTVLIFETKPNLLLRIFDYVVNFFKNSKMGKGINFKTLREWVRFFEGYSLDYRVSKFIFTHYIFKII